jgi:hypothetical protein
VHIHPQSSSITSISISHISLSVHIMLLDKHKSWMCQDYTLLGHEAVSFCRDIQTFRRNRLLWMSNLKVKVGGFSQTFLSMYQTTRHYLSENRKVFKLPMNNYNCKSKLKGQTVV